MFESCPELRPAFELLFKRPDKLQLVTGETFPTERAVDAEAEESEMVGVEHLGQYVYEITQAKVKALKEEGGQLPPVEETKVYVGEVGEEEDDDAGGVAVDGEAEADNEEVDAPAENSVPATTNE